MKGCILQDNVSLKSMDTSGLLDILRPSRASSGRADANRAPPGRTMGDREPSSIGLKSLLEGVEELWDNSEYTEEFSVENFVHRLS